MNIRTGKTKYHASFGAFGTGTAFQRQSVISITTEQLQLIILFPPLSTSIVDPKAPQQIAANEGTCVTKDSVVLPKLCHFVLAIVL